MYSSESEIAAPGGGVAADADAPEPTAPARAASTSKARLMSRHATPPGSARSSLLSRRVLVFGPAAARGPAHVSAGGRSAGQQWRCSVWAVSSGFRVARIVGAGSNVGLSGCLAFGEDAVTVFCHLGVGDVFDGVDGELAVVVEERRFRE